MLLLRILVYGLGPLYMVWMYLLYGNRFHLSEYNPPVQGILSEVAVAGLFLWAVAAAADVWFTCFPDESVNSQSRK